MANFDPPFASVGGVNRPPTPSEQADGFQCGDADPDLFNQLFGAIQAELKDIQDAGGIAGDVLDNTTVRRAIEAMIAAATGGGDTSQFVLFSQAQARLLTYPETVTNDGVIAVTSTGAGNARVPAGATIRHRGIRDYTTALTDFVLLPTKIYHLRWTPVGGLALKDLSDLGYNPTLADEKNPAFDSTYDDVLISRIITNAGNVPAFTNLRNKDRFRNKTKVSGAGTRYTSGSGNDGVFYDGVVEYNLGRTPLVDITGLAYQNGGTSGGGVANRVSGEVVDRYGATAQVASDFAGEVNPATCFGEMTFITIL